MFLLGFGNNLVEEEKTIESLVNMLKDEIKFIHAFVICFKQQVRALLDYVTKPCDITWCKRTLRYLLEKHNYVYNAKYHIHQPSASLAAKKVVLPVVLNY